MPPSWGFSSFPDFMFRFLGEWNDQTDAQGPASRTRVTKVKNYFKKKQKDMLRRQRKEKTSGTRNDCCKASSHWKLPSFGPPDRDEPEGYTRPTTRFWIPQANICRSFMKWSLEQDTSRCMCQNHNTYSDSPWMEGLVTSMGSEVQGIDFAVRSEGTGTLILSWEDNCSRFRGAILEAKCSTF